MPFLPIKQEPVFDLVKRMTKAEKRNFKLYATRLDGNQQAKFVTLFDVLDAMDEYDEVRVLQRAPIKKEQLPNMKAHLYKQILVSLRMLGVQHSPEMQLREQIDFAKILYDKGLYRQAEKFLERTQEQAAWLEQHSVELDVIEAQRHIETFSAARGNMVTADIFGKRTLEVCSRIEAANALFTICLQLYSLYRQLGYARTQKDIDLMESYFRSRIEVYTGAELSFTERLYYHEALAWYHSIRHDFVRSYRHAGQWIALFDARPEMKELMYDNYLKGYSRILEGLFLMRKHKLLNDKTVQFSYACVELGSLNENAFIISRTILYTALINTAFIEGDFRKGIALIPEIEAFIKRYEGQLNIHIKMLMYYKIACLYFGEEEYAKCMDYLGRITNTKDPQIRRDLQCFAKILHLIASYEAGIDYNLDYQIRSVYRFLVKMNDLQHVQREMLAFLKKLNTIYQSDLKEELHILYERLKPYEEHPYERRTFYYLDILSWLESKITGRSVGEIIREKFRQESERS